MENKDNLAIKTNLQYKEHGNFFNDFFTLRKIAYGHLAETITNPKRFPELYKSTLILVEYASSYISDIESIDQDLQDIDKLTSINKTNEAIKKVKHLLRKITQEHEASELLPQKKAEDIKTQKFWREEEHRAIRNMKKAFHDIFFNK